MKEKRTNNFLVCFRQDFMRSNMNTATWAKSGKAPIAKVAQLQQWTVKHKPEKEIAVLSLLHLPDMRAWKAISQTEIGTNYQLNMGF